MIEETKIHNSIFDPDIKIDTPNMLTELLMSNYFKWIKRPNPKFPFWRKEYQKSTNEQYIKHISKKYQIELSKITRLLESYSPKVLASIIKDLNLGTIAFLKKPERERMMTMLAEFQKKFDSYRSKPVDINEVAKVTISDEYSVFKKKLNI